VSDDVASATDPGEPVDGSNSLYDRWASVRDSELTVAIVTLVGVLLAPAVLVTVPPMIGVPSAYSWYQGLVALALIWGIFAIGYDILLGYTGLLSFGHAMFWGVAAYGAGIFSAYVMGSPLVLILVGTVLAVLLAWLIGWISLRRGGIYFAILTLAFGQMLYYIFLSPLGWLTGGENGFNAVQIGPLLGTFDLSSPVPVVPDIFASNWLYVLIGACTVIAVVVGYRVLNSPYGAILQAIRENEQRTEFVGLHVWRYKLMGFIISGAFGGLAGSLYVISQSYVPIENTLNWVVSGDVVVMTVLGGAGSLFGPLLGAGLYMYVRNIVVGIPVIGHYWHLILGLVFIAVVVALPEGIWGGITWIRRRIGSVLGGDDE
jgi:branched-chain amino acid transport system permease protein